MCYKKQPLTYMVILLSTFCLVSCKKDPTESHIIGKWQLIQEDIVGYGDGVKELDKSYNFNNDSSSKIYEQFNKDGSFINVVVPFQEGTTDTVTANYQLKAMTLTFSNVHTVSSLAAVLTPLPLYYAASNSLNVASTTNITQITSGQMTVHTDLLLTNTAGDVDRYTVDLSYTKL